MNALAQKDITKSMGRKVQATDPFRALEIEESQARAKAKRLEREFGKTIRLSRCVRSPSQYKPSRSFARGTKTRLKSGVCHQTRFLLPVAIGSRGRTGNGRSPLTFKITPIPKSATQRSLRDGTKIGPGAAAAGARYSLGLRGTYLIADRTQLDHDGETHVYSNIDDDPQKCTEFFELVEQKERNASKDEGEFDFGKSPWLWRRAVQHPECDPAVIAAYRRNPRGKEVVQLCRGGLALQQVLNDCDFRPSVKPRDQKTRDLADGIKWKLGRGGRTQWRVVVSFPAEFSSEQRQEALGLICDHFGAMGCMYMGVIHEASASNDRRNNHCHIDLYDRPCRRMTGIETVDLANVEPRWKKDVQKEFRRGDYKKDIGRWDFEVTRECTYESGNKRPQSAFRAKKAKEMRGYTMPVQGRRDIASIINHIALRDAGRAMVDHRTNEKRGIDRQPHEPVGPGARALEAKGWATEVGLRNEQKDAEDRRRDIHRLCQERIVELQAADVDLCARTMDQLLTGTRLEERKAARAGFQVACDQAILARDADLLQLEIRRRLSSAYFVIKTSSRIIRAGEDKRGEHVARRQAARDYWRAWVTDNAEDIRVLEDSKAQIRCSKNALDLDELVMAAVTPELAGDKQISLHRDSEDRVSMPILPTKRMTSLLLQQDGAAPVETKASESALPLALPEPITAPPGPVRIQISDRPLPQLVVPPLPVLAEPDALNVFVENEPTGGPTTAETSDAPIVDGLKTCAAGLPDQATSSELSNALGVVPPTKPVETLAEDPTAGSAAITSPVKFGAVEPIPGPSETAAQRVPLPATAADKTEKQNLDEQNELIKTEGGDVKWTRGEAAAVISDDGSVISIRMDVAKENLPACPTSISYVEGQPDVADSHVAVEGSSIETESGLACPDGTAVVISNEIPAIVAAQAPADPPIGDSSQDSDKTVKAIGDHGLPPGEGDGRLNNPDAIALPPELTAGQSRMAAWNLLDLSDMETRDEIERSGSKLVQIDGEVLFAKPDEVPMPHRLFIAAFQLSANRLYEEQVAREKRMRAWNLSGHNELGIFEEIERARRPLVHIDGAVSFANPDLVPEAHRLCLAAFQRKANLLFVEQESRLDDGHAAASIINRGKEIF